MKDKLELAKEKIAQATNVSSETAAKAAQMLKDAGQYLTDLNGDGKIDKEDLKLALEKAGYVWDKIDPDVKEAVITGATVGGAVAVFLPIAGTALAGPIGATVGVYSLLKSKLGRK